MHLSNCSSQTQLTQIETLYLEAFPKEERKPFSLILKKSQEGLAEILAIEDPEGLFLGFAITVLHKNLVLLDYFAVSPGFRGKNIGSETLGLLQQRHASRQLVIEIEDPREPAANQEERIRRKSFYLKNGMRAMPYSVLLFGIKMLVLTNKETVSYEEYHEIYESVFPGHISGNICLCHET